MPASDSSLPLTDDPPSPPDAPPAQRPWWLLLRALLWLVSAQAVGFEIAFLIVVAAALSDAIAGRHGGRGWDRGPLAYALPATAGLQAMLLLADFRQGRSLGHGNLLAGLGAGPMRRHGIIVLFVLLIIAWVLAYIVAISEFPAIADRLASDVPAALALPESPGILLLLVRLLLIAAVAPLAEELFFRGWLWTALRRSWGVWPTALCTGSLWLAVHALSGAARVPILIPAAILLSLARHYGGSVRASLPIHIANNTTAVMVQYAAILLSPH